MDVIKEMEIFKADHMVATKFPSENWWYEVRMTRAELDGLVAMLYACSSATDCDHCLKAQRCLAVFDHIMELSDVEPKTRRKPRKPRDKVVIH